MASNVLGGDATSNMIKDKSPSRNRRPWEATSAAQPKQQWGPSLRDQSQPGMGSKEERRAIVRERKRQQLLMSNANPSLDALRVKRRTSDDFESTSAPPGENEDREALIYVHHVAKTDTLAGLSIKYGCPMAILKKANRMYSDVVQTRKEVVLPVDACGARGRRCASPAATPNGTAPTLSKAGDRPNIDTDKTPRAPQHGFGESAFGSATALPSPPHSGSGRTSAHNPASPSLSQKGEDEKPWRHDSWVQLDGHVGPTEIARLSRRDLGFFPRARRKSVSYSDLDTPSASFDLPRPSITVSDAASARAMGGQHHKRGSSGSAKGASGSMSWAAQMSGPGGVGNLRGKGESAPGPGQDKFIKAVSKHLPNMAPPKEGVFAEEDEDEYVLGNGGATGLEQLGGQIEGWMRGVGKKINKAYKQQQHNTRGGLGVPVPGLTRTNSRQRTQNDGAGLGLGSARDGDLIEMNNSFEIGDDDVLDEDRYAEDRGRSRVNEGRDRSAQRVGRDYWDEESKSKGD